MNTSNLYVLFLSKFVHNDANSHFLICECGYLGVQNSQIFNTTETQGKGINTQIRMRGHTFIPSLIWPATYTLSSV